MPRKLLSIKSVCERLDVSDDTVRRLVKKGLLAAPHIYTGVGTRWAEEDIEEYMIEQRVRGREKGGPRPRKSPPKPPAS